MLVKAVPATATAVSDFKNAFITNSLKVQHLHNADACAETKSMIHANCFYKLQQTE